MNKSTIAFVAVFFPPALNLPLSAETALEQFEFLGAKTEFSVPQPAVKSVEEPRVSPEEAREKLPLFDYRKTDVLSAKRSMPSVQKGYSVEKIELLINDPLRQLGEFKQEYIFYKASEPGPRHTVLFFPPFMPQKIEDWSATHFTKKGFNVIIFAPSESLTDTTRPLNKVGEMLIRGVIRECASTCLKLFQESIRRRYTPTGSTWAG